MSDLGTIYFIRMSDTNYFKIGFTTNPLSLRVKVLQGGCPHRLEPYGMYVAENHKTEEKKMHEELKEYNTGDNFNSEWFFLDPSLIDDILKEKNGYHVGVNSPYHYLTTL